MTFILILEPAWKLGDVNGDGYDDFIISGTFSEQGFTNGKAFLYFGGSTIDTLPITEFHEQSIEDSFGSSIEGIGDINKDGYADFIICDRYNWENAKGFAYLFWGGDTISWAKSIVISDTAFYPQTSCNIGDINNDGFDDFGIGVSTTLTFNDTGKVYIYYGGHLSNIKPNKILTGSYQYEDFGAIIENGGDLNKDNQPEYFIGGGSYIYVYNGNEFIRKINGNSLGLGGYINIESGINI